MPPEVMTRPEVVTMLVTVVLAVLGALTAFAAMAKRWADGKFKPIEKDMAAVKSEAVNNHGPEGKNINLRDQIDTIQTEMRDGFKRMDHQFGEIHDRQIQEAEDRQAVDSRLQTLDKRAQSEHASIWDALRKYNS